jgi:polyhydroxybutyrate depolymerase
VRAAVFAVLSALAGCGSTNVPEEDGGLASDSGASSDAPSAPGLPDAGSVDAGPSMCAPLTIVGTCDGTTRTVMGRPYCVHVPSGYDGSPVPLVLMLHGYTADGETQANYLGLNALSDARTFLLVKPNGTTDSVGQRFWNASPACCAMFASSPPDDVAYLMAVLDDVESAYAVDTTREYVMGHSNGGFMTHRLACERGARFAAGASLAGGANLACTPTVPIAMLEVHGENDATIRYAGGTNPGASTPYPSVEETVGYWALANGCAPGRTEVETREVVCDANDEETHVERYSGCDASVELWRLAGVGHIPVFREPEWPWQVIDFLFAHRR